MHFKLKNSSLALPIAIGRLEHLIVNLLYLTMNYLVYILYSQKIDKYYVGYTSDLEARLIEHNEPSLYNNWSRQGAPWIIKFTIECVHKSQAIKIENHIKRNKSRKYLENLQKYPEIGDKLKEKYLDIIG